MQDPQRFDGSGFAAVHHQVDPIGAVRSESEQSAPDAKELLQQLQLVIAGGQALDLRLARLLAVIKTMDLVGIGFSSYTAFVKERIEWGGTWLRQLVRLASSDLPLVKQAVALGRIPLSKAVQAPGKVAPEDQLAWLLGMLPDADLAGEAGSSKPDPEPAPIAGSVLDTVLEARRLARLCLGKAVSDAQADSFVLQNWRQKRRGADIISEGRVRPDAPLPVEPRAWGPVEDPATSLVGSWRAPSSPEDALRQIERVQEVRRGRLMKTGHLYRRIVDEEVYARLGFRSLQDMVKQRLPCSMRTLQRHARMAQRLTKHPAVVRALGSGLDLERARRVVAFAPDAHMERWLRVARRVGVGELGRVLRLASNPEVELQLLVAYERALELAPAATDTVSLRASWATPPAPHLIRVHPDLPEAAAWFIANVHIEPQRGFGKVKERDDYTCQNPECGRRSLRAEAHHIIFRSKGGDDSLNNGITLCRACHLRLVHAGIVTVERLREMLVWTYPGRRVVVI